MKIRIPDVLLHLRGRVVREKTPRLDPERIALGGSPRSSPTGSATSGRSGWRGSRGRACSLRPPACPGPLRAWSEARDLPPVPQRDLPRLVAVGADDERGTRGDPRAGARRPRRGDAAEVDVARLYRRAGARTQADLVELLDERISAYRATVRRTDPAGLRGAVEAICRERDVRRLGIPPGLPAEWRPAGVELIEDDGLTPRRSTASTPS